MNHAPGADITASRARAGRASGIARRLGRHPDPLAGLVAVDDREAIQALLNATLRMSLSGAISVARANLVMRGCNIATRNLDGAETRPTNVESLLRALTQLSESGA